MVTPRSFWAELKSVSSQPGKNFFLFKEEGKRFPLTLTRHKKPTKTTTALVHNGLLKVPHHNHFQILFVQALELLINQKLPPENSTFSPDE